MRIAVGRLHLELPGALYLIQLEHGDVVGAAAQVEHGDLLVLLLVESVGKRSGRRLVDNPKHLETGDPSCVLGRLALRVVEVGGHGDDGLDHLRAEVVFRRLLHFLQNHGRDFRGSVLLALNLAHHHIVRPGDHLVWYALRLLLHLGHLAAHEALDREDGVCGIRYGLPFGYLADEPLTIFRETDHRWGYPSPFRVGDDDRIATLHDRNHGIGCPQIDADDFFSHSTPRRKLPASRNHRRSSCERSFRSFNAFPRAYGNGKGGTERTAPL